AHVADRGRLVGNGAGAVQQAPALLGRVGDEVFLVDDIQRGERGGAGDGVAAVSAALGAGPCLAHQLAGRGDGRQREAARQALGGDDDVRADAEVLVSPELPGPAEAGLYLVDDQ